MVGEGKRGKGRWWGKGRREEGGGEGGRGEGGGGRGGRGIGVTLIQYSIHCIILTVIYLLYSTSTEDITQPRPWG